QIDAGFMFPPQAHNAIESAARLYPLDYFAFTFNSSTVFNSATVNPAGRDTGVELRGLLFGGHLEYRGGIFQGFRQPSTPTQIQAQDIFRIAARLQLNLWDAEPGFFYAGTYLGKKKILSIGGAIDVENNYYYWAGDVFLDLPHAGNLITA